jgi:uncharacterized protein (TIGR02001 family)
MMKPVRLAMSVLALALALPAFADDPAPAPADPLSINVSVTSDYRYRGISQSRLQPALQGGADYAFDSGFYVGTWLSTIKWIKDTPGGGSTPAEWDIYGGYKTEIVKGLTLDVGGLKYQYVNNKLVPSANTFEVYGALTYGPVTAKYSHSTTTLFGFPNSKNSGFLDLSASFDLGEGFTLAPEVGHQTVKNDGFHSYTTYSLTLNKDYAGFTWGAAVVGTDADKTAYLSPSGENLGKTSLVVSVKKTF